MCHVCDYDVSKRSTNILPAYVFTIWMNDELNQTRFLCRFLLFRFLKIGNWQRNIISFNHLSCEKVKTNIGKTLLSSCMSNMVSIIRSHNGNVSLVSIRKVSESVVEKICSYRGKAGLPLKNKYLGQCLVYDAVIRKPAATKGK